MPVKTFTYTKTFVLLAFCFYVIAFSIVLSFFYNNGHISISFFSIVAAILGGWFFIRFAIRVLIPAFTGKTALILDEEKLFCRPQNKTVYWSEVGFIARRWASHNKSKYIAFELSDGK